MLVSVRIEKPMQINYFKDPEATNLEILFLEIYFFFLLIKCTWLRPAAVGGQLQSAGIQYHRNQLNQRDRKNSILPELGTRDNCRDSKNSILPELGTRDDCRDNAAVFSLYSNSIFQELPYIFFQIQILHFKLQNYLLVSSSIFQTQIFVKNLL